MEKKYSTVIADAIKAFLRDDDWKFFFDEEKGTFRFGLKIKSKMKHVDYTIIVHETDYTVYATSPVHADDDDADCMASMAEFITRANYGLRCGNWEMDYNDGEIRYKVYVDVENIELPASIVKHSIYCAASMFERYGDGIIGVIYGGESPKVAVKKSEDERIPPRSQDCLMNSVLILKASLPNQLRQNLPSISALTQKKRPMMNS